MPMQGLDFMVSILSLPASASNQCTPMLMDGSSLKLALSIQGLATISYKNGHADVQSPCPACTVPFSEVPWDVSLIFIRLPEIDLIHSFITVIFFWSAKICKIYNMALVLKSLETLALSVWACCSPCVWFAIVVPLLPGKHSFWSFASTGTGRC